MTKAECEQAVSEGTLGIRGCYYDSDYWAGAVRACGGVQNMPTKAQLTALAEYIYPDADSIDSSGYTSANWDADRASLFTAQSPGNCFYVWSGDEASQGGADNRLFVSTYTLLRNYLNRNDSKLLAVCLDQ